MDNLVITGINYDLPDEVKQYTEKSIKSLSKFLPRHARKSASFSVKISKINSADSNNYEVEIIAVVPDKTITAKEVASDPTSAIDLTTPKMSRQLRKYKQIRVPHLSFRGVLSKFKRGYDREK